MNATRPNLLFVMTDHQRADSLGMVQSGVEVTPNLNRLAAAGTTFRRAYNTCPLCVPARTALATGKYPTRNGVVFNDWKGDTAGDHSTLHEYLHGAGYDVAHIGVHHVRVRPDLRERVPFSRWVGNEEYAAHCEKVGAGEETLDTFRRLVREVQEDEVREQRYSNTHAAVWPGPAEEFKDLWWCRQAVDFIAGDHGRPFALFLYLWAPHPPLRVPEPYASLFDPERIELPENTGVPCEAEPDVYRRGVPAQLADGVSRAEWQRVWAAHLGLVHLADTGLGRVLDALKREGQAKNTLTVFTADHGDHLGQHRMYQKMEMYEQAVRVPLVMAGPGIARTAIETPVSHLDVLPSLADLFGLDVPEELDGRSLAPTLEAGTEPPARSVHIQYSGNSCPGDLRRCVISRNMKYVWSSCGGEELFELDDDPLEMNNLAACPAHAVCLNEMRQACRQWARKHDDTVFQRSAGD